MFNHIALNTASFAGKKKLKNLIENGKIILGGNSKLKIYGTLTCGSGKRMKKENHVFFGSEQEAIQQGYRPCGNCMNNKYKKWKMELFNTDMIPNILPADGVASYYGKILPQQKAQYYFNKLLTTIEWKNDEAIIFGRHIITKRKVAWYADTNYEYAYSNRTKYALPWNKELVELKTLVDELTGTIFNSCLLNLYHNGDEGMTWHSDDEKTLADDSPIASFSFGAERKFMLKHKQTKETISLMLENGSLLVMKDETQKKWLHGLPKSKRVTQPRVNLTFRIME